MQIYDYIVIGAGSSGCPVARGLSDDPRNNVLLIEAVSYTHLTLPTIYSV